MLNGMAVTDLVAAPDLIALKGRYGAFMAEHVYPLFADVVFRDPVSATRWGHL